MLARAKITSVTNGAEDGVALHSQHATSGHASCTTPIQDYGSMNLQSFAGSLSHRSSTVTNSLFLFNMLMRLF